MNRMIILSRFLIPVLMTAVLQIVPFVSAEAMIQGITGPTFNLTASAGHIYTGDGDSVYMWGYGITGGRMQYTGPTLIVNQGDLVTVTLTNQLSVRTSIVFPGQAVTALGGMPGLMTREAPVSGAVTYTFTASEPGTYVYYSGTQSDLQVEMGLVGALIVRPASASQAYNDPDTAFDHEYLFLATEIDPSIHKLVENGQMDQVDMSSRWPVLWFFNGRNLPDTMAAAFVPWLPSQPYNCMPMTHPGETVLMRIIGGGLDLHPLHTHGNNHTIIARDGRLLKSNGSAYLDLALSDFTTSIIPGETVDALWEWTGTKLGWDIYGHDGTEPGICVNPDTNGFDPVTHEYCPDHGKPIPVILPDVEEMTFGPHYSGSPYLGGADFLPPGEGGFNPYAGIFFMWHSHNEKELTNNDIFVGGMATMAVVLPPGAPID
jgi:FtsP/CotA-like multicopper oxidase with cupredoxin domain